MPEWLDFRALWEGWEVGTAIVRPAGAPAVAAPAARAPLTRSRADSRGFDIFFQVVKERFKVEAAGARRRRRFQGMAITVIARTLAWPEWAGMSEEEKRPYMPEVLDDAPVEHLAPTGDEPVTPKKRCPVRTWRVSVRRSSTSWGGGIRPPRNATRRARRWHFAPSRPV